MKIKPEWLIAAPPAPKKIPLWPGEAPVEKGVTEKTDAFISVYRPENPNGTAVVICPGGGYGMLVMGGEGAGIAKWLNTHGITGVVLKYRLPKGKMYRPLFDAQRAIRIVRSKAAEWKCDTKKIGIIGFSAGGHLASSAATHFDEGDPAAKDEIGKCSCRPDFAILIYPVISMGPKTHRGSKKNLLGKNPTPEMTRLFSNELQVTEKTPPTFLAHAEDDRVVVTHGNGPVVGNIVIRNIAAADRIPPMPLDICGADSQGGIGYMIVQSVDLALSEVGMRRPTNPSVRSTRRSRPRSGRPTWAGRSARTPAADGGGWCRRRSR